MTGLQLSVPQRLTWIRTCLTLGLLVSFPISFSLWSGDTLFPDSPLIEGYTFRAPFDLLLTSSAMIFLVLSLLVTRVRLFISLALLCETALSLADINRLQPWFVIYNAVLFILLFYDGRVDNPRKYNVTFVLIQIVCISVYTFNGLQQLNPYFASGDFTDTVQPLASVFSQRQFELVLHCGKFVPYTILLIALALLLKPLRYIGISLAIVFHVLLLILLFPSQSHSNAALWFMNLVFTVLVLLLFSGQTSERHFSWSFLFQRPVFYLVILAFWIFPGAQYLHLWPGTPYSTFMYGKPKTEIHISASDFATLPPYLRHFCRSTETGYALKAEDWCRHELRSEFVSQSWIHSILNKAVMPVTAANVKETEEELSAL